MNLTGLLLCLLVVGIALCAKDPLQEFVEGNAKFSADVVRFESLDQKNNGVITTLTTQLTLALLADGAKGQTYNELKQLLKLPNKERTREAVKKLLPLLAKSSDDLKLALAQKLYLDDKYKVKKEFEDVAKSVFQVEVQNVNFSDESGTSEIINEWVINKTDNQFQNFLSPDSFDDETVLSFINSIDLKGKWETPFPKDKTSKEQFSYLRKDPGDVEMMHNTGKYLYFHCGFLKAKFLEIPLKGNSIKFTFVLPDAKDGIKDLEKNIDFYLAPHNVILKEVAVSLPKFTAYTYHDFKKFLMNAKAGRVLSKEADLSGISEDKIHLSAAPQRAYISIDEQGLEAEAATAIILERSRKGRAAEPALTFKADHPFFYVIREAESNVILCVGRFL